MCLGIILTLTCFANFPALQPAFEKLWGLSKTQSGLIIGIFFGGVLAYISVGLAGFAAPLAIRFMGLAGDPGT